VREYFQRDIERTKKVTTERARQRVAREAATAAGNNPAGGYDEEAQIQDAINLSRAEAEFRQGVEGRGGTYERGWGSGSAGLNPFQRMLRRAGSRRDTPVVVEDYNLAAGGRSGMTQTRIDIPNLCEKKPNLCEVVYQYQLCKHARESFFGNNVSTWSVSADS
jgi:hypothetical protein